MSLRTLPSHPSLKSLRNQAKQLLRAHRAGQEEAYRRLLAAHPRCQSLSLEAVKEFPLSHADALLVLAREYGFPSWSQLIDSFDRSPETPPTASESFASEPGWEWILAPSPDQPLGSSGGIGAACPMMYENEPTRDALSVHVAVGAEFICREWRLVALEAGGQRHVLKEHGSGGGGFEIALFGYRLPYSEVPHGAIQSLGIEAVLQERVGRPAL